MLYFNDFLRVLDIIQEYRRELQNWQEDYPYIINIRVNNGEATEEEKEYLREYNLGLEELRSRIASKLASYIDSPQDVLPYIERM